ncbi:MAG: hypothetical protein IJ770_04205 [Alphaproteobacteria bacterium]|nr:hypothetical protein [Alphaproteobacteria bacterium]
MRYAGKEYRVVCSKSDSQPLIVDIMPADNALHRLILEERKMRDASVKEIAGSIKLYDMGEGNKPEILFLPPENGSLPPVELSPEQENRLRYKIAVRFENMMAQNRESTIIVRPEIHQAYVRDITARIVSKLNAAAEAKNAPQSLQEEQERALDKRRKKSAQTRLQTAEYLKRRDEKYSRYNLTALQVKQMIQHDY